MPYFRSTSSPYRTTNRTINAANPTSTTATASATCFQRRTRWRRCAGMNAVASGSPLATLGRVKPEGGTRSRRGISAGSKSRS